MGRYLLKRILGFIPGLFVVALLAFVIGRIAPGNPIATSDPYQNYESANSLDNHFVSQKVIEASGLRLPVFYFSLESAADADTLYRIADIEQRQLLSHMCRVTGKPDATLIWFHKLLKTDTLLRNYKPQAQLVNPKLFEERVNKIKYLNHQLSRYATVDQRQERADTLLELLQIVPGMQSIKTSFEQSEHALKVMMSQRNAWLQWLPVVRFHGASNQYHVWLFGSGNHSKGILRGDFGYSLRDGQAIGPRIAEKMLRTLALMAPTVLLTWLLGMYLGFTAAKFRHKITDRLIEGISTAFWSLPLFFIATCLLMLFANPDVLDWFPTSGIRNELIYEVQWPWYKKALHSLPYLILPICAYTLASLALIVRQTRNGMMAELDKDYVQAARIRGVPESRILKHYALRNALLPLAAMLGRYVPVLLGGSVVLETVFNIPGLGLETYESILSKDYPTIVALFTIYGFLTMLGYLISDVLSAALNPRINLVEKSA